MKHEKEMNIKDKSYDPLLLPDEIEHARQQQHQEVGLQQD